MSLIQSPDFATKHLSTRSKSELDSVLALFQQGCSISIFSYQDLSYETTFKFRPAVAFDPLRFEIYHRDIISEVFIIGPCNGVFLIGLRKGFTDQHFVLLLWNPATREVFKLPFADDVVCSTFGFGFDSVTNDYKVVGLYGMTDGRIDCSIVWLYSLATNSWRQIVDDNYLDIHCDAYTRVDCRIGSSSNGGMHNWILHYDHRSQKSDSLLSFDMVDEVFVETPLPYDAPYICGFLNQGSNHIYPTVFSCVEKELHIWVLKGYGNTGVWNKQLNISFYQWQISPYMVLSKNKETVFSHCGITTSLNLTTQQSKSLRIPADGNIIAYTESLVSIANYVRQPPTIHHSSVKSGWQRGLPSIEVPLQILQLGEEQLPLQLGEEQLPLQLEEEQLPLQLGEEQLPLQLEEEQLPLQLQLEEEQLPLQLQLDEEQLPLQLQLDEEQLPLQLQLDEEQLPTQLQLEEEQLPLQLQLQLEEEEPEDDQEDLSATTMIHQILPEEDDDTDHFSTDSAFFAPGITAFTDPNTIYIDYERDMEFYPHRKNEVERLSKLPYCLHEVNQPMISNPCTF